MPRSDRPAARPVDCLDELLRDLCRRAMTLSLADADARERWFADVVDLLAHVRDPMTGLRWAGALAESFARSDCPTSLVLGELARRLERTRCAQIDRRRR